MHDDNSLDDEVAALTFLPAMTSDGVALVYVADVDLVAAGWGVLSAHYPLPDGDVLLETSTPLGLHTLSVQSLDDHRSYLEATLRSAVSDGPDPDRDRFFGTAVSLCPGRA